MTPKLLCFLDHPTQYDPPLWRALARRGNLVPFVSYVEESAPADPEIQRSVGWSRHDGGYEARTIGVEDIASIVRGAKDHSAVVLTAGWKKSSTWRAVSAARSVSVPLIMPSDKTLNERSPAKAKHVALTVFHSARVRVSADGFFTTGVLGRQALRSIGVPHERIATGLYPIAVDDWQARIAELKADSARLRAKPAQSFVVLAVSKWSERENPFEILEAFAQLRRDRADAHLIYVGDGPLREGVNARVDSLGLRQFVMLPGYVEYKQLPAFYGAADVFVHVPKVEPWGISVLEAMASGLPVVASTTVGSAADLVVPGQTGALCYPGSVGSLAQALLRVANGNPSSLGKKALARVRRFDVDAAAANLEELAHLLREKGRGTARFDQMGTLLSSHVRNVWGRWPA